MQSVRSNDTDNSWSINTVIKWCIMLTKFDVTSSGVQKYYLNKIFSLDYTIFNIL